MTARRTFKELDRASRIYLDNVATSAGRWRNRRAVAKAERKLAKLLAAEPKRKPLLVNGILIMESRAVRRARAKLGRVDRARDARLRGRS